MKITSIKTSGLNLTETLAEIHSSENKTHPLLWNSLTPYWEYATPDDCDYIASSYIQNYAVFTILTAQGQGGIIAVWDLLSKKWCHVSGADYSIACLLDLDKNQLITFCYISNFTTPGYHAIFSTELDNSLNGKIEKTTKVETENLTKSFSEVQTASIIQEAYGSFSENISGPMGIFKLDDGSFLAHDAGNLYRFQI